MTAWLSRHALLIHRFEQGADVYEFQPLAPATVISAQFGPSMELAGVTVTPNRPQAGGQLDVTLYWRTSQTIATPETVSVQFLSADGKLAAQNDAPPQAGGAPTTSWQPFEVIPDLHQVPLPTTLAPGTYTVGVVVYPSSGGPRLTVPNVPSGLFTVATVEVGP